MAETLKARVDRLETLKGTITLLLDKVEKELRNIERLKARIEKLERDK